MSEDYRIVSQAQGEPLPAGSVGVRVRIRLSGCPSREWSRRLSGHLARELLGRRSVGHLRLNINDIVQGNEIVLEGVEAEEAASLARALQRAVDAANETSTNMPGPSRNVSQKQADDIASRITLGEPQRS